MDIQEEKKNNLNWGYFPSYSLLLLQGIDFFPTLVGFFLHSDSNNPK